MVVPCSQHRPPPRPTRREPPPMLPATRDARGTSTLNMNCIAGLVPPCRLPPLLTRSRAEQNSGCPDPSTRPLPLPRVQHAGRALVEGHVVVEIGAGLCVQCMCGHASGRCRKIPNLPLWPNEKTGKAWGQRVSQGRTGERRGSEGCGIKCISRSILHCLHPCDSAMFQHHSHHLHPPLPSALRLHSRHALSSAPSF
ncbi:unnamed protein product [Closterium sp. Yama58-4]|nr:unnamed protein product [Closterium sp. Yama58-4]